MDTKNKENIMKLTFLGAGSTVFAKNVIGDVLLTPELREDLTVALYDISEDRLEESYIVIDAINRRYNGGKAKIEKYLGVENRKEAFRGADFIVNAIQVGGYDPCTIIDFEIPKKYGVGQIIADTLGIGGIFRGLRTIQVMKEFAREIEEVCPNAWLLNYTNPMSIITGYMQRYTKVKTIGLCHSVQVCSEILFERLGMDHSRVGSELIAGINHMGWLLEIKDKEGKDLYPEIAKLAKEKNERGKHIDMVRYDYIDKFGYYCTESSTHAAEYTPFYVKSHKPELLDKFNLQLDDYIQICKDQIANWAKQKEELLNGGEVKHETSIEYASHIMKAIKTNTPFKIGANVINNGVISNLPDEACVEVPCLVDGQGVHPTYVGRLPVQCAGLCMTNINCQLVAIEAAVTGDRKTLYQAAFLDPHTSAELSLEEMIALCDELIDAHEKAGYKIL